MDDYLTQLFPYLDPSNIKTLSCSHVIPPTNLFVTPLSHSHNNHAFDFTFGSRNSSAMITALGESILKLLPLIPNGAVAFFPSYSYLDQVVAAWQAVPKTGGASLWARMQGHKALFRETQTGSADAKQDVLAAYTAAVTTSQKGALLLAVIGGRLSEGINFSDKLGRCVMVIGLPYPNPHSPEWKAKTAYIEERASKNNKINASSASRNFAENICMRAVNQAIGRAVRHKGDWSAILLFDGRYGQTRIQGKLPGWIRESLRKGEGGFGEVERGLRMFYEGKREK